MVLYGTYPLEMEVLYGFIWFYMVLYGTYPLEMEVLYGFIWFYMGHIH